VSHGTTVIVDYAHLPSEVANAILAARASGFTRVGAVFQPHRVTRTTKLAPEFAASFDGLQALVVTDIYRAGEANPEGVTGELVARAVGAHHGAPPVRYVGELDAARAIARSWLGEMDAVLLLGAGDVNTLATELVAP
jgi:UDP-N-acetylmuramate--alanine ligase